MPRAINAPIIPLSTSPLPALASPAFPVGFTCTVRLRCATSVPAPFNTTVADVIAHRGSTAPTRSFSTQSRWLPQPSSRVASPMCGVTTYRFMSIPRRSGMRARALSASASNTMGNLTRSSKSPSHTRFAVPPLHTMPRHRPCRESRQSPTLAPSETCRYRLPEREVTTTS